MRARYHQSGASLPGPLVPPKAQAVRSHLIFSKSCLQSVSRYVQTTDSPCAANHGSPAARQAAASRGRERGLAAARLFRFGPAWVTDRVASSRELGGSRTPAHPPTAPTPVGAGSPERTPTV